MAYSLALKGGFCVEFREVYLLSKCRVTDPSNDCPQNSSKELTSKTIIWKLNGMR
jgi:hypothetical protein